MVEEEEEGEEVKKREEEEAMMMMVTASQVVLLHLLKWWWEAGVFLRYIATVSTYRGPAPSQSHQALMGKQTYKQRSTW